MKQSHWSRQPERSGLGMNIMFVILRLTGPRFVKVLTMPVALYYYLTSQDIRKYSRDYFVRLRNTAKSNESCQMPRGPISWLIFLHILSFAQSMVDRVHVWFTNPKITQYSVAGMDLLDSVVTNTNQGALFLVSHLGNYDLAMKATNIAPKKYFNVILSSDSNIEFNRHRFKFLQSSRIRFIEPSDITALGIMSLMDSVSKGEIVVIAADRTVANDNRNSVTVEFLGDKAMFPKGPYLLAQALGVPVYTLFSFKKRDSYLVLFQLFEDTINIPRNNRENATHDYAQKFAAILEQNCLQHPLDWYNFYDFWEK